MRIQDYSILQDQMTKANQGESNSNTISALLLLLEDAREILFPDGKYKKLHWLQFRRLWKLAKVTIRLINTLMGIFKPKVDTSTFK